MAKPTTPPEGPAGPPPAAVARLSEIAMVEIAKLQNDGEHIKSAVKDLQTDVRNVRDRVITLETEVRHLPSKGFIVSALLLTLAAGTGLLTVLPKLQGYLSLNQSPPAQVGAPSPAQAAPKLP